MSTKFDSVEATGFMALWKQSGPAWMSAGLNIGGATVANSVSLAALTGLQFGWVFILATFAIFMCVIACVKLTIITGKNPISLIREYIHPVAGWAVGLAVLIVNLVFHLVVMVIGAMVLSTLFPGNASLWGFVLIVLVAFLALYPTKTAAEITGKMMKYMVYVLSISFFLTIFFVKVDWAAFFLGLLPTSLPDSSQILLFTAVLGSALAINVPTIQAFASKTKGYTDKDIKLWRFETGLTHIFLFFVQIMVLVVVASTLFPAGIVPVNAVQAAMSLEPLAGRFATILFSIGLFGAVISTLIVQTQVAGYTFSDLLGWDPEPGTKRFKMIQGALLVIALTVPLFQWSPFTVVAWGGAFNASFMPIGLAAWWYLMNRKDIMGQYKAGTWVNVGLLVTFLISLTFAIRFWYVTLG